MLDRLYAEWAAGANRFDAAGEGYWGLFSTETDVLLRREEPGGALCAVGGLNADNYEGGADFGRVRHLYVHPEHRRNGLGAALLRHIVAAARPHFAALRLRTGNPVAARFYEAHGFARTDMPAATHWLRFDPARD